MGNGGIAELVYRSSLVLLYPTLVLLAWGFLRTMWHLGETVHDAWVLRAWRNPLAARQLRDITLDAGASLVPDLKAVASSRWQHPQLRRFVGLVLDELGRGQRHTLAARIDHLVVQVEAGLAREVNRLRVLVRVGPLLGLVGTLIPLGPGLMALHEGDLARLSSQLVVAFSTTVVGLLIGGVSYCIAMARAQTADLVSGDVELVRDLVEAHLQLRPPERPSDRPRSIEGEEGPA